MLFKNMPLESDIADIVAAYKREVGLDKIASSPNKVSTAKDAIQDEISNSEAIVDNFKDEQSIHSTDGNSSEGDDRAPAVKKDTETSSSDEEDEHKPTELDEQTAIGQPKSKKEKQLMALIFGGKAELVSNLEREVKISTDSEEESVAVNDKKRRTPAWHDSDDDNDRDFPSKSQKTELRATVNRRRKNFEKLVGQPKWADLDRQREVDSDDELLKTVGHVVKGKSTELPKEIIELKRLKSLNRETKNEGEITTILFHPSSMVAVMTGMNGLVSIVAVDGTKNEKLHTIGLKKFKIACCRMTPDGNELVIGSFRKFYHIYNLITGRNDTLQLKGEGAWNMKNFEISKCGKYLAATGGFGEIHLFDARSKELLTTIQQKYCCSSLCFTPDSEYLFTHSTDNEVSVYHIEKRRFVNVFTDEGCVNGSFITICPNSRFVATGSRQGIVNIYHLEKLLKERFPVPVKTVSNLTTSIGSIAFNVNSELLAIASPDMENAVKLVHMKSGTVYRNFPIMKAGLGHVTRVQFSPGGGYLALGNREGIVTLFRVKHYQNY
ncbi:U3 small nucleolar RNA-associated protein 18 homolog [Wyeomyia smithii]|uniref:U3 small nucleolar RNA-associated protein 18 homolog n=1 Tax=Wyeomyia smithii TaxID=174621 RepID=UPI0024680D3C|nr:U3 small nucleolar RNA-associated protein 18 homolog [Wyeomyia smithii]